MQKEYVKISSEALDKTFITDNWQFFSKKLFQPFIHHQTILKVRKFQFKIICCARVLDKNIPLWYIVSTSPPPLPPMLIGLILIGLTEIIFFIIQLFLLPIFLPILHPVFQYSEDVIKLTIKIYKCFPTVKLENCQLQVVSSTLKLRVTEKSVR